MNSLDLYAIIEEHLDFSDEVRELYQFYIDFSNQKKPNSLIDIGCGQGEFLLSLNNSINTLGVDLSFEQIKIAKSKNINAQCIDISEVKDSFDMATAVFDVLNYIDGDILKKFIESTYKVLNRDGYFLFDINTLYGFEVVAEGSLNINLEDKFIGIDAYFENKTLTTNINLFKKENASYTRYENHITQYFHEKNKMKKLLTKAGFTIEKIIDFNLHGYEEADKYIFICKK